MATAAPPRRSRGRRRLLTGLVVLIVLVLVVFAGAAWYYSGEIHAGALEVETVSDGVEPDTVIDSVADGEVVLRRIGEPVDDDPLLRAETYGLVWDGGAAVISGAPQPREDGSVARRIELVDGAAPAAGTVAELRRAVWTDPAAAYDVAFEEVTYPCPGGGCPAWFVPGEASTWMIFVHGRGGTRAEPLRALGPAVDAGLPSLVISYRNDAGAPADPSGEYRFGATEWRDLEAAVEHAVDRGAEDVVLFGASMGGGIVASFLERSERADVVSGIVLDAPMLDLDATVELGAAQRELPVIGSLPGVLTDTAQWIVGWRYDLDWDAVDYLPADWLEVPALVFHGTDDRTVPVSVTDELAADRPDLVRAERLEGVGHVAAWNADPAAYEERMDGFLACVAEQPAPSGC